MTRNIKRLLVTYETRQVDSNLLMAGTVFDGLQRAGYDVDVVFCGSNDVAEFFKNRYGRFFRDIIFQIRSRSLIERFVARHGKLKRGYTFYRQFIRDLLVRDYSMSYLKKYLNRQYDCVLSFVPTYESGRMGYDVAKHILPNCRLVQFWTDPIALGGCKDAASIPRRRFLHLLEESRLLAFADKVVCCYPLLCELEKSAHPAVAHKITWSDVGYIEHRYDAFVPKNQRMRIGLFGAYQRSVRNVVPLLEAVKALPNFDFIIRGDADVEIDSAQLPNLDIKAGRIPVEDVEKLESECDVLISLCGHSTVMPPGKTFYYASYHKPIIFIIDGPQAQYMFEHFSALGRYRCCFNNCEDICKSIEMVAKELPTFQFKIPERMQLDVVARKIIEV